MFTIDPYRNKRKDLKINFRFEDIGDKRQEFFRERGSLKE